jgi:hypothetical protein
MPDSQSLRDYERVQVRIGRRVLEPASPDRTLAAVLTTASWLLAQLPDRVVQDRRGELVRTLAEARDLVIEVHCAPALVLVRDGDRPLVRIPARP